MRTIVQILPDLALGGVQKVVCALVKNFRREKWRRHVLTLDTLRGSSLEEDLRRAGITVESLNYRDRGWSGTARAIRERLNYFRPEIVHLHGHTFRYAAPLARKHRSARFFFTIHEEMSWRHFAADNVLRALLLRFPIEIVAVSQAAARAANRTIGLRAAHVIENGIEPATAATRSAHQKGFFTFAMVARLAPRKGHDVLLKAFSKVVASNGECRLILIGDGRLKPELMRTASDYQIQDKVRFAGEHSDVYSLLGEADALAHPSLTEGSSLCCMEAMFAGLPTVVSDAGALPEIVVDGETGFVTRAGDANALANAMIAVAQDRLLATRLGEAGRKRAVERYTASRMATDYDRVFNGVAS